MRLRKKLIGSIGDGGAQLPGDERGDEQHADDDRHDDLRRSSSRPALPRTRPQTMPSRPVLASARPGQVEAALGALRLLELRASASGASTSPIGTLSQKIQFHETPLTIAPPTSGPSATARPPMPPQMPSASPRRSAGTAAERIVSVSGVTIAPPTPWSARAMSSAFADVESAAAAEAPVKSSDPEHEHAPAAEAVAERRAGEEQHRERERVRVHRPLELRDRRVQARRRITGRAVVTTRLSRLTMKSAIEVIASVQ